MQLRNHCFHWMKAVGAAPIVLALLMPAAIILPSMLSADIFRCVSDQGVVTYSDQPCGTNAKAVLQDYVMKVDDAARREIIKPATQRTDWWDVEEDIKDHARILAQTITPNQSFHHIYIVRRGTETDEIPMDLEVTVPWGPEEDPLTDRIDLYYRAKKDKVFKVWLRSLKVLSDRRPYDPPAMKGVRLFKKAENGEWEYRR